jgi:hypothetical protein
MEFLARDAVNRAEAAVDPSVAAVGMLPPPPRPTDRAREAAVPLVTETCLVGEDGKPRPVGTGEGTFTFASPEGRGRRARRRDPAGRPRLLACGARRKYPAADAASVRPPSRQSSRPPCRPLLRGPSPALSGDFR